MEEKDLQLHHQTKVHRTLLTIPKQSQVGHTGVEKDDLLISRQNPIPKETLELPCQLVCKD
jgi:hypothetical protein